MIPNIFNEAQPGPSQVCEVPTLENPEASTSTASDLRSPLKDILNTSCFVKTNVERVKSSCGTQVSKLKTEGEKYLYNKCVKHVKTLCQVRNCSKNLRKKALLNVLTYNNDAVRKLQKKLTPTFAVLLQAQIRNCNKTTGRRWTKEKIVALRLFKRSPTCYRLLRRLFQLPSPGTLKALLNKIPFAVGITNPVLKVISEYIKGQQPSDNHFILMFDEMSLKKHLNYNKKDYIEGFQDHGPQGRSSNMASYAIFEY